MNNGHSPYLFQFYSFERFEIEEKNDLAIYESEKRL